MRRLFHDRRDAGKQLAQTLLKYRGSDVIVLGLPRGGVPVAYEVAKALGAPLDVLPVRKLGAPGQPEFGFGAIAPDAMFVDERTVRMLGLSPEEIQAIAAVEEKEMMRRQRLFRGDRPYPDLRGKTVIIVDDGLATGGTARAAVRSVRQRHAARIVLAVPVGAPESVEALAQEADEVVCLAQPEYFQAVGLWYEDFAQTQDKEVAELLADANRHANPLASRHSVSVHIPTESGHSVEGDLIVPAGARSLVIFAHGSGSSRLSPRNRVVAEALQKAGLATLLMDLLTREEEAVDQHTGHLRFDIPFLARRLMAAIDWAARTPEVAVMPVGLFGASTGLAAALIAAAERPDRVKAVVSRGGRPDLAPDALPRVMAPTLLIVGGDDDLVIGLNEAALARLRTVKKLAIIPGAGHLFEEPGKLEQVAELAVAWFTRYLALTPAHEKPAAFETAVDESEGGRYQRPKES